MNLGQASVRAREHVFAGSAALLVLIVASLPALSNAAALHSDAAVVGLQAMHPFAGPSPWFLWGSGYQTCVDAWVAAGFFAVFGATPFALVLSTFSEYAALTLLAFLMLRRRFEPWSAALLVCPLALMAAPVHIYAFSPPRQASLTLLFLATWIIDSAQGARSPAARIGAGAFAAGLACFADPYCLLFMPAVGLFIAFTARHASASGSAARSAVVGFGALALGLVPFWGLSHTRAASHGVFRLTTELLAHNFRLLIDECLPYLLSTRVKRFSPTEGSVWWHPPAWFHGIQILGAALLITGIVVGGILALRRGVPAGVRRLGVYGALMLPVTLAAFLVSVMPLDRLAARYLVAIVLTAPFALAPVLRALGRTRFAVLIAPYAVSVAAAGWLGFGDDVDGWRIRRENGIARDEHALAEFCRSRGIHGGMGDYWVAYRLTFLFQEDPIVVPWHASLDRHASYRKTVASYPSIAYVYDPAWSTEDLSYRQAQIRERRTEFEPVFEAARVGRYTVLVLHRRGASDSRIAGDASLPSVSGEHTH